MLEPVDPVEAATWCARVSGPPESRIRPASTLVAGALRVANRLPRRVRGYGRACVLHAGRGDLRLLTSFGELASPRGDHTFVQRPVFEEPFETALMARLLTDGDTFVDVGANRGWFTLLGASAVGPSGRVLAFEPDDRVRQTLLRNLEVNPHLAEVVDVWSTAVGTSDGRAEFVQEPESGRSHLLGQEEGARATVSVEVRSLASVLQELDLTPDAIKIDVEGNELDVLAGLADCVATPAILVEVVPEQLERGGTSFDEILALLGEAYRCYWVCWTHGRLEPVDGNQCGSGRNMLVLPANRADEILGRLIA